jgi:threonine/homoserine/homoserine lactone efflux protein
LPHSSRMLFQGFLLGLVLSFAIGPLLFSIIQACLHTGLKAGLALAAGIWISDVVFVVLLRVAFKSFSEIVSAPGFRFWASISGGALLLFFGAFGIYKAQKKVHLPGMKNKSDASVFHFRHLIGFFFQGFLLNSINPGTIFFWISVAGGLMIPGNWSDAEALTFFGAMLLTLVATDVMKAYGAHRLKKWLTPTHIRQAHMSLGVVLMVIGFGMALNAWFAESL